MNRNTWLRAPWQQGGQSLTYQRGWVNRERLIDRLVRLCSIDSAPRHEGALAAAMAAELAALGCSVESDGAGAAIGGECGNLLARLPGSGDPVLFVAHLDRYPGGTGVRPRLRGDALVASGTILGADAAAGLAVALELLAVLRERGPAHPALEFAFTVGEELGLLGAAQLDPAWFRAGQAYCLDGEGPVGTACVEAPHQVRLTLRLQGADRHAPAQAETPGSAMQITGYAMAHMRLGRVDPGTVAQVGAAEREPEPGCVELWLEVRAASSGKLAAQEAHMRRCVEAAAERFGGRCTWLAEQRVTGYRLEPAAPVLTRALAAMAAAGVAPLVGAAPGASDANVLVARGIPTLLLGMGFEQIHTTAERMPLAQLKAAAELALAIVLA